MLEDTLRQWRAEYQHGKDKVYHNYRYRGFKHIFGDVEVGLKGHAKSSGTELRVDSL